MLPKPHKLTSPAQFRRTIKGGRRAGSRTLVVHVLDTSHQRDDIAVTGPRFGLVVSKAVGNAVVRHRTSRRLRHVCLGLLDELPGHYDVVIRALPASGNAPSAQLDADLRKAFARACRT